jgi:NAD(P)H dehydrogenase (quinone)
MYNTFTISINQSIKKQNMILVTGATGHFGKATISYLLKKGIPAGSIAALVRDEAKATELKEKGIIIRKGDYGDYSSLVKAFSGVDKLLLVSATDIANRLKQQENAVKAAKEAGVKFIAYTSFERKNETDSSPIAFVAHSHISTEEFIKASGIPYTILRNNIYMDVLPMFLGEKVLETGVYWPAGTTKSAFVLREEMAEAAATVLTGEGHENKTYRISNTANVSFDDVAAILSNISGKTVPYINPSPEEYKAALSAAKVPAEYIGMFAGFAEAIKQGEFESSATDLEKLLGRKPATLEQYLREVYA